MPTYLLIIVIVAGSILGLAFLWLFGWLVVARIVRKIWPFPAPAWIGGILDSDFRRNMYPPDILIERSGVKPGMKVLEVGAGSGAYTTFVARAVGPEGKVYALDIQAKMLDRLQSKLVRPENQDIKNIELIQASAYQLPVDDGALDLVYMITVLPEIPDRHRALLEVHRVLKPDGTLALTEIFTDPDYPLRKTTTRWAIQAGFEEAGIEGNFWHYTARFIKPKESTWL